MGITKYVAQSKADDGDQGVPQLDVVADNGICELSPIQWSYSTMWFVDAVLVNDNATPVYKFGPSDYVFAPLPFYATVYNEHNNSKLLTSTFEAARMDDQSNLDQLFSEVLDYFEGITAVTEIPGYISDIFVYPNPARDVVTINYNLKQKSDVNISIYGMQGNLVSQRKITDKILGNNSIVFSAKDLNLNKGIYYCNIVIDNNQVTKKILIIE